MSYHSILMQVNSILENIFEINVDCKYVNKVNIKKMTKEMRKYNDNLPILWIYEYNMVIRKNEKGNLKFVRYLTIFALERTGIRQKNNSWMVS